MLKISIIQASYKSGLNSISIRDVWLDRATHPEQIEHCVSFESNDVETIRAYTDTLQVQGISRDGKSKFIINSRNYEGDSSAVDNWNLAASISTGEVLFVIADDTVPDQGWDETLRKICKRQKKSEFCLKISDNRCSRGVNGERDGLLPRHPILSRTYYSKMGFIFDPIFSGAGADDQLLHSILVSKKLVDAREFRIHHAKGNILNKFREIQCGCGETLDTELRLKNYSQQQIAKSSLGMHFLVKKWGISWTIVHMLAMSPDYSDEILFVMNKMRFKNGFLFLILLLFKISLKPHLVLKLISKIPSGIRYLVSIK